MKTILFACTENAGRSQIAAALFNKLANPRIARAISAGTRPAKKVHKNVIISLEQSGIDITHAAPRLLTKELASESNLLVTMGCKESCPQVPGLKIEDWDIEDVKEKSLEETIEIQKVIEKRIKELIDRIEVV